MLQLAPEIATPDFVEIDGNPAPPIPRVRTITTRDGVALRAAHWPADPARPIRGSVLLFQGRAEFIEKYFETVRDLCERGFHVATLDWRGQGGSARRLSDARRGHVASFKEYEADLAAFLEQMVAPNCPKPWFGLAHSMGAAILIEAVRSGAAPLERLIALAPMIGIERIGRPKLVRLAANALALAGLGTRYVPGGGAVSISTRPFQGNPLTSDEGRYARNAAVLGAAPRLGVGAPTIGWVRAALAQMARFAEPRYAMSIRVPILVIMPGGDRLCSLPAMERFAARLKSGSGLLLPQSRHEILMERDAIRSLFWAAFDAFVPGASAVVSAKDAPAVRQPQVLQGVLPAGASEATGAPPALPVDGALAVQQPQGLLVEAGVAGRDD